ncbi:LysR family transcriptional regulator [Pseudoxanthomonas kaohsiungensis]|uniref:LysR family transcriptional regulator n=1 Tax=Pseudoxanthomonas kaohsiungensis TaxID=283923 RepID=A0ABW3LTW7_9GAMM|nr:LysR family transcriptional regulator [Pseudoxanthomonas kaohsiungensis]KAF1702106.1 LysR family transcriptional regulator [Pseudoxanthomonas kaohsiungensis]
MDRVGDLALFLRVLDLGSITAAARSLDLSVAVASQRLKRLERDLGVRLLHRTTRRLHPTPEGAELAQRGRLLVEEIEALGAGLRESAQQVAGTLRVTASASFGRQYIARLLPEFLDLHPRLRVSLDLDDRYVDLVGAGFDLAIRIGALGDSSLVSRQLAVNRRLLCASPDYLARRGAPATPADLAGHDCVLLTGRDGRQDVWTLQGTDGQRMEVRVAGRFESNYGEALRDAALAGLGIALHSTWHVHEDLRAGRLLPVLSGFPVPSSGIHAVMPGRRQVPPRVRAFVEFLAGRFAPPPWEPAGAG